MPASPLVELRQYTLLPGKRDVLIDLFETNFIESQEELGMPIIGTFRDLDDPTKFVWLRGFDSMEERPQALAAFYYGPVWKAHSAAANGTMIDSDDVLLLRQAPGSELASGELPPRGATRSDPGLVDVVIFHLQSDPDDKLVSTLERSVDAETDGEVLGTFVTEHSENNFPALPVREANVVLIVIGHGGAPADPPGARRAILARIGRVIVPGRAPNVELLRLEPTVRSRLAPRLLLHRKEIA